MLKSQFLQIRAIYICQPLLEFTHLNTYVKTKTPIWQDFFCKKVSNSISRAQGYSLDKFTKDKIYKLAFEGGRMCYLVNMISESYVEVSKNYLLDRIAGMSISLDNHIQFFFRHPPKCPNHIF